MDFMTRRSIRKYKEQKIEKNKIDELIKAALVAPTGRNSHSTKFLVIDDVESIKFLSNVREHGSAFAKDAPLIIAVLGEKSKSTTLSSDCSIAAFAIQMEAHELGLGSCWVHIENRTAAGGKSSEELIRERFNIPEDYMIMCMIAIGYPDEIKPAHKLTQEDYKRVYFNSYKEN
ncbi:nitroreductase family protein [Fusobacterium sp.]|uniref:nitroreductase family protein n=1 Tax=Fusobacterium sp. TaxID=68766 RepID=UPI00396C8127